MLRYKKSLYADNSVYDVHKYKNRAEWLKGRVHGIGGSDASAAINRNPWRSNLELWQLKTHRIKAPDISNNERVIYGQEAEEYIRRLYQLKRKGRVDVHYMPDVVLQNKADPILLYSPDGLLQETDTGRCGILEVKTATPIMALQREKWKDQIPENYFIQVLHGMNVTGFDFVDLIAELTYDDDYSQLRIYHIERSDVIGELEYVKNGVLDFWNKYVQTDTEPPLYLPVI